MAKIYKTASGALVDMDKLRLLNEMVPAVGNMDVNARGDEIDNQGNVLRTRNEVVQELYNQNKEKNNGY